MVAALGAGVVYFALVFAAAFMLGILRQMVIAPLVGAVAAVAIEMPVVLFISYLACRAVVAWFKLSEALYVRALVGVVAFGLLMAAELMLSNLLFGIGAADFIASFITLQGLIGFAGQVIFAMMPLFVRQHVTQN
ncbi:MAG: hypothetical protein ABL898_11800 [Hyphomicrobiaceae bacterium]|nr:hypothetical protein [Hyphomicrobiaceae bacterium]